MKRYITPVVVAAALSAGCGGEKADEVNNPPVPPAGARFDKGRSPKDQRDKGLNDPRGAAKKPAGKFD